VYTVLGFSFGWFALAAVVAVIDVLTTMLAIAVTVYGTLALIGVLVFTAIGIRRWITDRRRNVERAGPEITPPIVVSDDPDCKFYRTPADALAAGFTPTMKVFDGQGHRLLAAGNQLFVSPSDSDGAVELAEVLRRWLGYMDAIRWSTADMELELLVQASVEHLGYSR
jgi:hypothetical protein